MSYEINVSHLGKHYFATDERSMRGMTDEFAIALAKDMRDRFPKHEGFEVTLCKTRTTGEEMEIK